MATLLAAAWLSHFAILRNDVFPLRWQADQLSLNHPESFYNGFFPIGYPILLRLAAFTGNPVLTIMLVQIALAPIYLILLRRFFQRTLPAEISTLALPFVLFFPHIARAVLTPTPDFLAALFVLSGFVVFVRSHSDRGPLLAGLFMGIAYLFRSHILVLLVAMVLALLLFQNVKRFQTIAWFVLGAFPFLALQGIIQRWSGHGIFETSQAFNVWRVMYGMDWNNPPLLHGASMFAIIRSNPSAFLSGFWIYLVKELPYLIPLVLALVLLFFQKRRTSQSELMLLLFSTIVYLVITASGGSPRNVIAVVPSVVAACAFLVSEAGSGIALAKRRLFAHILAWLGWVSGVVAALIFSTLAAHRVQDYREVEHTLQVNSPQDAQAIYTDDFDLYFPDRQYESPRKSGGWPQVGLPAYDSAFPPIRDSSAYILHSDLVGNGIHWAIFRTPPYDPRGYQSVRSDTALFRLTYRTPRHEIYRVE